MTNKKKKPEVDILILRNLADIWIFALNLGKTPEAIFRFSKSDFSKSMHAKGRSLLAWLNWGDYYIGKWFVAGSGSYLEN